MQLKRPISGALMVASCALLGTGNARADEDEWQVDSALLYYKEDQGRVQAVEPVVNLKRDYGNDTSLGVKLTYDSLSGGSPNGAIPSHSAQTFATPSGTSLQAATGVPSTYTTPSGRVVAQLEKVTLYTTDPGKLPLDPNFHDQRVALSTGWQQRLSDNLRLSVGGDLSHELDFMSAGANGTLAWDFNSKNTTLSFGGNFEADSIRPIGGAPVGGSDYTLLQKGGNGSKTIGGGLIGLTQVLSRRWLAQLNLTYDTSHGYQNDPYKIVSLVDALGNTTGYRFENRPGSRTRKAAFLENKIAIGHDVLDFSVRHMSDDWGIRSNTAELRYRLELPIDMYLEPHVRYYRQTGANFYDLYLIQGTQPDLLSADPRLGAFTAKTYGLKIGLTAEDKSELSLRLEYYEQTARDLPAAFGQLQGLDLSPGLKSFIVQLGWRFSF